VQLLNTIGGPKGLGKQASGRRSACQSAFLTWMDREPRVSGHSLLRGPQVRPCGPASPSLNELLRRADQHRAGIANEGSDRANPREVASPSEFPVAFGAQLIASSCQVTASVQAHLYVPPEMELVPGNVALPDPQRGHLTWDFVLPRAFLTATRDMPLRRHEIRRHGVS
jgi:hypothetical protein